MRKVIVILGQTTTGKSDLAVKIAQKINGEIISADSRQVYQGLNIGTGKITKKEMRGVAHHLLDVVSPKSKFSVALYQKQAISAMADIVKRGKTPIICGGTGFYIDAVTNGIVFPEVPPNYQLRKELALVSDRALMLKLRTLDPIRAKNIDAQNKVRLIRAIEIVKTTGKPVPTDIKQGPTFFTSSGGLKSLIIGIKIPKEKMYKRIDQRLRQHLKQGMIQEVKNLLKKGISHKRLQSLGLEYRFISLFLQNKLAYKEMTEKLKNAIHQYAKRQMTWFKRNKDIHWISADSKGKKGVLRLTKRFLRKA